MVDKKKLTCPKCETELDRVMVQAEAGEYPWSEKDGLYEDRTDGLDWVIYCPHCKGDLTNLLFREPEGYVLEEKEVCTEPCELAKEKGMDCCGECVELGVEVKHQG